MIAGKGTMKDEVVHSILIAGSESIRYMGWMDSREALRGSDVFVLPSTEKGQPVALLEAGSGMVVEDGRGRGTLHS